MDTWRSHWTKFVVLDVCSPLPSVDIFYLLPFQTMQVPNCQVFHMSVCHCFWWYVDDIMLSHTIPGLDWALVVLLTWISVCCCGFTLWCKGGNDSLLAVFYCSSAHILFQLQTSVHGRLRHFAHLTYIRYLCLHCVQVMKDKIYCLIPKSKVIVEIKSKILSPPWSDNSVALCTVQQEVSLHQELHPHQPLLLLHPESQCSLHQRRCFVFRWGPGPLPHVNCEFEWGQMFLWTNFR